MDRRTKIAEVIERISGKKVTISPEASLFETGILDSFALVEVLASLENEFGITIPDSDLSPRQFDSLVRIENYIENKGK